MKKRLLLLTILCVTILGIVGCSKDNKNSTDNIQTDTDATASEMDATEVDTETTETTAVTTEESTVEESEKEPTGVPSSNHTTEEEKEPTKPAPETSEEPAEEPTPTPVDNDDDDQTCKHNWKDATCCDPKTCTKCGATEGKALGHGREAVYATRMVDDTSKPIYEEVDNGHYEPIYELHEWSGSLDVTIWCQTTGWTAWDAQFNEEAFNSWLANGGHPRFHVYTKEVQVGEEWVPNIEKVLVGYEQKEEKYVDHYECPRCGTRVD